MNRAEYIRELKTYLNNLSEDDKKDAIEYCNQYFDEAGISNEEQAIKELGTPKQFANNLIANITIKNENKDEQRNKENQKNKNAKSDIKTIWIILIAIAALPFGLPIILSILAVLFGLFVASVCIIFAIGVVIFAVPFGIIFGLPIGVPFINNAFLLDSVNPSLMIGTILLSLSILILSLFVLFNIIKFGISIIKKIVIVIYNKINKNAIGSTAKNNK